MENSSENYQVLNGGGIFSDTSNYNMLNSSIFTPINLSETQPELLGGHKDDQYTEYSQISEFNIDKLFEGTVQNNNIFNPVNNNTKTVDGIFSPTSSSKVNATDIEKAFEQQIGGFSETSSFNLNMANNEFSATSSCKF